MKKGIRLTFIGKVHNFGYHRLASYVPKSVIEFYGIDIEKFRGASWHDDMYYYRTSPDAEWEHIGGYLGLYSSRKTLRLVFSVYGEQMELAGKTVEFCVQFREEAKKR